MKFKEAVQILKKSGVTKPADEVFDLLAVATNQTRAQLLTSKKHLTGSSQKKFDGYVKKRAGGMPYAYVVEYQPFLGHNFFVTKDTLIPRPATEDLVLAVEKYLHDNTGSVEIFDIGTGSGCIAISLALRNPKRIKSITATDVSAKALAVAKKNYLKLKARQSYIPNSHELEIYKKLDVKFKKTALLKNISLPKNCIVIANLPYVRPVRNQSRKIISNGEPKSAIFCSYKNGLPVTYLELLKQLQKQKNLPHAVFLEIPRVCSARFQKLWHSTLPNIQLIIIGT